MTTESADPTPNQDTRLTGWQVLGVLIIAVGGLALTGNGLLASYEALHRFAVLMRVPAPDRVALGFEGALIVIVSWDIVLTWTRRSVPLLRWVARVMTVLSVVANASAGWPEFRAMMLYVPAPLGVLAIVESIRHVLLAKHRTREPIPFPRWFAHFGSSYKLRKLMIKWEITSYREALDMEQKLEHAKKLLEVVHGEYWRGKAPADLVWMLDEGVMLAQALPRVYRIAQAHGLETGQEQDSTPVPPRRPKPRPVPPAEPVQDRQDRTPPPPPPVQDNKQQDNPDPSGQDKNKPGQDNGRPDGGDQDTKPNARKRTDADLIAEMRSRWATNPGRPTVTDELGVGTDRAVRLMRMAWPDEIAVAIAKHITPSGDVPVASLAHELGTTPAEVNKQLE
ncbi:DUF2637 domain-containing protein [Nonomuraea basaltis]|uniref:DUF2637 domain-containing protein n=1 Tax=Nonomuraea basaltis TaxID=2495887 RepID=UPI00110C6CCA|nr:DUF2637 domain-containing protein [Nonomuraea basaltis]TMR87883.1 hypothetical protein EJK15_69345 [Nonomuraea basaltis]